VIQGRRGCYGRFGGGSGFYDVGMKVTDGKVEVVIPSREM